jgi:hypothetical protein
MGAVKNYYHDEICARGKGLNERERELYEALELADCLLSGANMNRRVVERKVKGALAAARGAHE